jgi:hypothetical protein
MQEPIQIVGCTEVVDNWGRQEKYTEQETYGLLINPDEWTDDQTFWGPNDERYFIDDLIGKRVKCGPIEFTVQED